MRACLARFALLGVLLLPCRRPASLAQEQFPGTSYITPFPAGDTYRMQVYGDAFAEGLLGGLVDTFTDDARVQLQRRRRPLAGITRPELDDELKAEEASKDTVHIAVVMIGYNDRYHIRTSPRDRIELGSPEWRAEYGRRVDRLAKTLKKRGTAVYWVGLPIMRRPRAQRARAGRSTMSCARRPISTASSTSTSRRTSPTRPATTPPYGPDVAGKQRLVREPDGVLFTVAGISQARAFRRARDQARPGAGTEASAPSRWPAREAEQKRIAALRPRPPDPDDGLEGQHRRHQGGRRQGGRERPAEGRTPAGRAPPPTADALGEPKADHGRIVAQDGGSGRPRGDRDHRAPRPAIPAAVLQLITRKDTGDRPSQMGDALADDVGGGLVVLSSVTPVARARRAAQGGARPALLPGLVQGRAPAAEARPVGRLGVAAGRPRDGRGAALRGPAGERPRPRHAAEKIARARQRTLRLALSTGAAGAVRARACRAGRSWRPCRPPCAAPPRTHRGWRAQAPRWHGCPRARGGPRWAAARHADLDLDLIDLGFLRRALRHLDADTAARHALEVLLELCNLLAHPLLDGLALLDAVKMDLDWRRHEIALSAMGTIPPRGSGAGEGQDDVRRRTVGPNAMRPEGGGIRHGVPFGRPFAISVRHRAASKQIAWAVRADSIVSQTQQEPEHSFFHS